MFRAVSKAPGFASMKARRLRTLLVRELGYEVVPGRGKGSHRLMRSPGRGDIWFAYHDGDSVGADVVKRILVRDAGLSLEDAKEVAGGG